MRLSLPKSCLFWAWLALLFLGVSAASAQTTFTTSTAFAPAQSGRTYMDIGGVWNGSTEVTNTTGDTFTFVITNTGATSAFEISPRVTLPAHFQFVPGTVAVSLSSGGPITISASQSGNLIIFVPQSGYDLPAGVTMTITYGLRVLSTMPSSGTYSLTPAAHYATTNGGSLTQTPSFANQNILVQQGATIISKSPTNQLRAVNQNALFTVTVTNTGLGALYDVTINESAINPGGSLQLVSMTKTAPTRAATGSSPVLTMPYLAPGESFVVDVVATVTACANILNTVSTTDRTAFTAKNATAPVVLDLQQPLITYSPPNATLSYSATTNVSFNVQNTGLGDARNITLDSNLESLGVTVSSVSAGWSYNASNGVFTYTGGSPAGTIANSSSVALSYNLDPTATTYCSGSVGGTVIWKSSYTNGCGDAYSTPTNTSSVSAPTNNPTLTLNQSGPGQRIANGETGSFVVTLNATNTSLISGTSFTVTETLPSGITGVSLSASSGTAVYNAMTNTVTWSGITKVVPTTNATLTINFTAQGDPCAAGTQYTATASTSATTTRSCPLSASASATYLLTNNPGATVQQYFEVTPAADGFFETGLNSTTNTVRETALGEGEFIQLEARYAFDAGYAGFWTGSTYADDFAGVSQQVLVPNTLQYSINNGGSWAAVPGGSVTGGTGSLSINLAFLQTVYGDNNVSGKSLRIRYSTTIPDAGLNGNNTRALLQRANLTISGTGGAGACTVSGSNFRQGVFYSIARAAATIGVNLPSSGGNQIAICQVIDVTLSVNNATVELARNLLITLNNNPGNYEFLTGASQTITYGGVFNSGNITYSENGGNNPTWTYTGATLTGAGTITFKARLKATSPLTPSSLGATVAYDDLQTHITPATREFSANGSGSPFLVRSANLNLTVTPNSVIVIGSTIEWKIYVSNGGDGPAYNSILRNTLPTNLEVNTALTNAANAGYPVTVSGSSNELLTWSLGDIPSGVTRLITVVADINASTGCSIPNGTNSIVAEWGCGGTNHQTTTRVAPNYNFPAGQMLVAHNTTNSVARLCEDGLIEIIIRNTGPTEIFNIVAREVLDPASGLTLIPGTVQYSINSGGSWVSGGNPTGTGSSGDPYTWNSTQIPPLANLKPSGSSPQEVRIRFNITAGAAFASANPSATASAVGNIACGNPVNSPGTSTAIPTEKPNLSVALTGRNLTTGGTFGETVYGGQGEQVEWRLVISNTGNQVARNVRFRQALAGTNPTAVVVNGPGYTNAAYTSNTYINVNNSAVTNTIPAGSSVTYIITETLGNNCVPGTVTTADIVWGCYAPNPITTLTSPGTPSDTATLDMVPSFTGGVTIVPTVTSRPGGRAQVDVVITNNDATAQDMSFSTSLSSGFAIDTSVAPTVTGTGTGVGGITGVALSSPNFNLTGKLLNGRSITVRFFVLPTFNETTAANVTGAAFQATESDTSLDPSRPADGTLSCNFNYSSTCGSALPAIPFNFTIPLSTPDLDIFDGPSNVIVSSTTGFTDRVFRIRNNNGGGGIADTGSQANGIIVRVYVGKGWELDNTSAFNMITTSTVSPSYTREYTDVTPTSVGDYDRYEFTLPANVIFPASNSNTNNNIIVNVRSRLNTVGGLANKPLGMYVEVEGRVLDESGAATSYSYSIDRRRPIMIGAVLSKSHASTKSVDGFTNGSTEIDTSGTTLMIGEDVAYNVSAQVFGMLDGESVSSIAVRDTLSDTTAPAHNGLGYLGHTDSGLQNVTVSATNPTPVNNGNVNWSLTYTDGGDNQFTFNSEVRARALNIAANTDNKTLKNNFGMSFSYLGRTFRSNDGDDGFTGGTSTGILHNDTDVLVRRPEITVVKTARNLTRGQVAFSNSIAAQASEQIQYKVVITATAGRVVPIYDLLATDVVPSKMMIDTASIGADTNGDNIVDVFAVGAASGNTITFNQTTTNIASSGTNFDRLNSGSTITLLYTVTVNQSVTPSEILTNSVNASGDTLPGASGAQITPQHPTGNVAGAAQITATAAASTVIIDAVQPTKSLLETSVGNDTSLNVFIGEQARFQLTYVLPEGTVPNFVVTDNLPQGLALVETPAVTIGSAISGGQPTITPAVLPANGNPLAISWNFGTRIVTTGTIAQRTVTITYLTQVRNIAANANGTTLTNSASYSFTGSPINQNPVTLTVRTPGPVVTKTVAPNANFDAGDTLTYTISINNSASLAPAYDINILDTLDARTTFVPGSTTVITNTGVTGILGAPDNSPPALTWGRNQAVPLDIDIAAGGTLVFTYQVTVNNDASAPQILNNQAVVTWSSLNGDPGPNLGIAVGTAGTALGERTGTGVAPNNLRAQVVAPATVGGLRTLAKTASGHTLPLNAPVPPPTDAFRVGDIVTYTVVLGIPEGTTANATITDTLPAGLELASWSPITPTGDNLPLGNPFSYTAPLAGTTGPSPGATGSLTWQLGTIVNQGDNNINNNTLTLVYTAKVLDNGSTPATPVTQTKNNSAVLSYTDGLGNAAQTVPANGGIAPVSVKQPLITLVKSRVTPATNVVAAGDTIRFRLTLTNTGSGPAYNVKLTDTIPSGMRATTPVQIAATLNTVNVMATLTPSWNSGTGELVWSLDDTQPILPGQTLVVDYDVVVDLTAPRGATLTNSAVVNEYFSKESASLDNRRQYAVVGPDTEDIIVSQVLSGFVYRDLQPNGTRDLGEDWTGGPTVRVNLVNTATNTVSKTTTVPAGGGAFSFTSLTPGNYRLIVTTSAGSTTATAPSGYIFSSPSNGQIPIIISTGDIVNQTFGLFLGRSIAGRVFEDNGVSGGTAHDGIQNGAEVGIPNVTVRLTSSDGLTVYDQVTTDGGGDFIMQVPGSVPNGTPLLVQQTNLPDWLSVSGNVGTTAGTYTRATDRIAFTFNSGSSYNGLRFGDVRSPQFLTDGAQTILPGATATYSHQFISPTTGSVSFALTTVQSPVLPGWSTLLYRDTNNNGILDPAEPIVTGPVSVIAGQTVALIVKDFSPPGGLYGAQNQTTITATFTYTGVTPTLTQVLTRRDLTTLGLADVDGLKLVKATNKATALPGDTITYTITYTNNGTGPITTLVIHDQTPTYTTYTSAAHGPLPPSLTGCVIAAPSVGQTGGITWTFSGSLQPGSSGTVSYTVTIID